MQFEGLTLRVSDFVAVLNQTIEFAYPSVVIEGELANFKVSKNKWIYFDIKDEFASVRCFGTVYMLPGPLEDGMMIQIRAVPRLHQQFGFSLNIQSVRPVGEGSIKQAATLLQATLEAEGIFDEDRKRPLPFPPSRIGLITSGESAAYADFMKILSARWGGVEVVLADVQVQGEAAPGQIIRAMDALALHDDPVDVLVLIRGGGSADDLAAFSTEQVTRAVAASRIPTMVAIGHEIDVSLAELAADVRASTPSNAAELLVPDKRNEHHRLSVTAQGMGDLLDTCTTDARRTIRQASSDMQLQVTNVITQQHNILTAKRQLLEALSPLGILQKGYAVVSQNGSTMSAKQLTVGGTVSLRFHDGSASAVITEKIS